jgi:hypothetical protein
MLHSGLVSITFRQLSPREIIRLVVQAGLEGIEWGGDIHIPHGDLVRAREVRRMAAEAGLRIAAYGSYFRVGHEDSGPFKVVLETALELEAPLIRVWAGTQETDMADAAYFQRVVKDSRRIAELSAQAGIRIAYEFHANTLTDTNEAARKLLNTGSHEKSLRIGSRRVIRQLSTLSGKVLRRCCPGCSMCIVFKLAKSKPRRTNCYWQRQKPAGCVNSGNINTTGREHFTMLEFVKGRRA